MVKLKAGGKVRRASGLSRYEVLARGYDIEESIFDKYYIDTILSGNACIVLCGVFCCCCCCNQEREMIANIENN